MSVKDIEIQALRTYIENLEKKNDAMGAILRGQMKFSVNVAKIIFKMDNLLEKKQKRIEELETKLSTVEEFSAKNDDLEDDLIDELVSTESIKYEEINTEEFLSENHADIVEDIEIDIIDERTKSPIEKCAEKSFNSSQEINQTDLDSSTLEPTSTGFNCPVAGCSYSSDDRYRVKRHLQVHQTAKNFQCPDCSYKCKYESSVKRHIKNKSCNGAWAQLKKRSRKRKRNSTSSAITRRSEADTEGTLKSKKKRKTLG